MFVTGSSWSLSLFAVYLGSLWSWIWSYSNPPDILAFSNFPVVSFHLEFPLCFSPLPRTSDIARICALPPPGPRCSLDNQAKCPFKPVQILSAYLMTAENLGEVIIIDLLMSSLLYTSMLILARRGGRSDFRPYWSDEVSTFLNCPTTKISASWGPRPKKTTPYVTQTRIQERHITRNFIFYSNHN